VRRLVISYAPGPQSGGRAAAPGRLALVQAFLNTFWDLDPDPARRGRDVLAEPGGLAEWLRGRGLIGPGATVSGADHARAVTVRDGLRALLAGHGDGDERVDALRGAARGLGAGVAIAGSGTVEPIPASADVAGALGLVLALIHEAQAAGVWGRMKLCAGHDCGWAFYDHSRNQASRWCSVRVCGSREKARAYRARSRG
jgi:predicted RNA-binding Zn ribbon-like protein